MHLATLFVLLLASIFPDTIHAGVIARRSELDQNLEARICIDTTCRRGDDNEACRSACVKRTEHIRVSLISNMRFHNKHKHLLTMTIGDTNQKAQMVRRICTS